MHANVRPHGGQNCNLKKIKFKQTTLQLFLDNHMHGGKLLPLHGYQHCQGDTEKHPVTTICQVKQLPHVSQGSVSTCFRRGRIFNNDFITNLRLNLTAKEVRKSDRTRQVTGKSIMSIVHPFFNSVANIPVFLCHPIQSRRK